MTTENRRYFRLQPSEDAEPKAKFILGDDEIAFTVVNLSPGGLLCYVAAGESRIQKDVFIPKILIQLPHKKVLSYAGRVVRAETQADSQARFCAIEFVRTQRKKLVKGSKHAGHSENDAEMDRYFIHRLESIKFLDGANSIKEEIHIQEMLYRAFDDVARRIPLEERWFFYEILDAMKRKEPNYPEGMKQEFLRFCHGEDRSEFQVDGLSGTRLMRWFRGLLGLTLQASPE